MGFPQLAALPALIHRGSLPHPSGWHCSSTGHHEQQLPWPSCPPWAPLQGLQLQPGACTCGGSHGLFFLQPSSTAALQALPKVAHGDVLYVVPVGCWGQLAPPRTTPGLLLHAWNNTCLISALALVTAGLFLIHFSFPSLCCCCGGFPFLKSALPVLIMAQLF